MELVTKLKRGAALPLSVGLAGLMLAALFGLLTPRAAEAGGVVTVCDQAHLEAALAGGGSVTFNCGGPATITFSSQIVITQPTTIDGGTLGQVTFSGNHATRLFSTTTGTSFTLLNLTLQAGQASSGTYGAAVRVGGPTTLAHTIFADNRAHFGGAVATGDSTVALTITDSVFHHNTAEAYGGAVYAQGPASVSNSTFYSNTAENGGALAVEGATQLVGSRLYSNTAGNYGGSLINTGSGALTVVASSFYSNTAYRGAAIEHEGLSLFVNSSLFHHNTGSDEGGALAAYAPAVVAGSEFYSNTSGYGGALLAWDALTLTNTSLHDNTSDAGGGAAALGDRALLQDVQIYNNVVFGADGYGGGLDSEGAWAGLERVRIYNNRVLSGHALYGGGGLSVFYGTVVLTDSAVYNNVMVTGPGGGIHASYGATLTVVSSAIYSNSAEAGPGGGLNVTSDNGVSRLRVYNSTIAANSAITGGGVYQDPANTYAVISYTTLYGNLAPTANQISATAELHASILAGSGGQNCVGFYKSYGYNLEDGDTCDLIVGTDLTNTNPLLGPLAWYGGPTFSLALLDGSPAIDGGDPDICPATDQRGAARPVDGDEAGGAVCDIGAYEFGAIVARLFLPLAIR